jgi:hypothetical protein
VKFLVLVGLLSAFSAHALDLRIGVRAAPSPLTAQDLREWEPFRVNTYRALDAVRVTVAWRSLRVEQAEKGLPGFVAKAEGVESIVEWGMRGQGPWFGPRAGCDSVREFVALEAQARAERLARALRAALPKLQKMLAEISRAGSSLEAQIFAADVLENWVSHERADFIVAESKRVLSTNARACTPHATEWAAWSDAHRVRDPGAQPLARVPLTWFGTALTAKVGLDVGGRKISGRFLLDPSSSQSLVSAEWVRNQGIWLFEVLREGIRPATFQASWGKGTGIPLEFDHVEISGHSVPVRQFLSAESELLFDEDLFARGCCDGVLGRDVFRHLSVEFELGATPRMLIWPPEDASLPLGAAFLESFESSVQGVVSPCGTGEVRWMFFVPQSRQPKKSPRREMRTCSGVEIETESGQVAPFQTLADRFFLDLTRGRVAWISRVALRHRTNPSGFEVAARWVKGEGRRVEITRITPRSPAGALAAELGIRPGAAIVKVNGRDIGDLDAAQVEAILSGRDGDRVQIWVDAKKRSAPVAMSISLPSVADR